MPLKNIERAKISGEPVDRLFRRWYITEEAE